MSIRPTHTEAPHRVSLVFLLYGIICNFLKKSDKFAPFLIKRPACVTCSFRPLRSPIPCPHSEHRRSGAVEDPFRVFRAFSCISCSNLFSPPPRLRACPERKGSTLPGDSSRPQKTQNPPSGGFTTWRRPGFAPRWCIFNVHSLVQLHPPPTTCPEQTLREPCPEPAKDQRSGSRRVSAPALREARGLPVSAPLPLCVIFFTLTQGRFH